MHTKLLIQYTDLKSLKLDDCIDITLLNFTHYNNSNIIMTKIMSNENSQNFRVEMSKGCKWNTHFHDCIENIVMYEGTLLNMLTNETINRLEKLKIEPYVDHSIEAMEDSIFYVEFVKPQI